jgi:hypothetical protein
MTLTASDGDGAKKKNIAVAVVVTLSALLLLAIGGLFIWSKFFRNRGEPETPDMKGGIKPSCKSMC